MPDWFIRFPSEINVDITGPIDRAIDYMVRQWDPFFDGITKILRSFLNGIEYIVDRIPWWLLIVLVFIVTWRVSKK